ncbi:MAG: HNH endonuclease [Anaerolineae bacterium]|nr:HNH endonuclease [Anaerolineae bacterium]
MTYIPEALRQRVAERAEARCEYCHLHEDQAYFAHEIDHIYAEKHGGDKVEGNLCLACADCNRPKGSDLCSLDPQTGRVLALFHPRRDNWREHFRLINTGIIEPLTATGRVTESILHFNEIDLVANRTRLMALGGYDEQDS